MLYKMFVFFFHKYLEKICSLIKTKINSVSFSSLSLINVEELNKNCLEMCKN